MQAKLAALTPGDLRQIADEVPDVSFSWLSQVARGKYQSEPTYSRLRSVADHLKKKPSPSKKARAA